MEIGVVNPLFLVSASMWRMAGAPAWARGAHAPRWRAGRPPPRWSSSPCPNAASPSSTDPTPTSKCHPNRCQETALLPAKGELQINIYMYV